ncbi:uncharacterized protein Dana_GF12237 [Drosophila ananassae]|uniref:Trichohyalin n=1 Tax=Drosophila ananassae TaxID=7217 RepID=B3MI61_DROAN|nr:uncharacterized protein Dana_GF12237 [Drosophila ananassae]
MRLFVIGLLALGSVGAFSVVRTLPQPHPQLVAYSPARGEFPVVSGLAQGYVRYFDGTGAERLLAYNYPEPLNGIRDLATSTLTRAGFENESQDIALFRAWCEQRYQVLRQELDRLRAQGQKPSSSMLAQFEPLEQIVKFAAFEAVPGLSPEVQKARDEQLRIWNEARLEVLRAEQAQQLQTKAQEIPVIYGQPEQSILIKTSKPQTIPTTQTLLIKTQTGTFEGQQAPQPIEETPEVKRAREEHLKQFNEALLRQPAPETPILKTVPGIQQPQALQPQPQPIINTRTTFENQPITQPLAIFKTSSFEGQQTPQPIEETPEVKKAREEHLKQFNEALLRQPTTPEEPLLKITPTRSQAISFEGQLAPQPVEETPEVKRAREEHLKQFNEAILRQPIDIQQQPLIPTAPIAPFAPQAIVKTTFIQVPGPQPIQDTPEVKLAREQHLLLLNQAKLQAEDKVADISDMILLEERERENERLLELEQRKREEKEAELERQMEADRLREETRLLEAERLKIEQEDRLRLESERLAEKQEITTTYEKGIPEYLRKAEQFKIISSQAQAQPQPQSQPNIVTQQQQVQNGFFLRIQTNQPSSIETGEAPISSPALVFAEKTPNPFLVRYTSEPQVLQPLPFPILAKLNQEVSTASATATTTSSSSSSDSELEKATREHFRAHEIALEQLRLANLKNPWNPEPCQH